MCQRASSVLDIKECFTMSALYLIIIIITTLLTASVSVTILIILHELNHGASIAIKRKAVLLSSFSNEKTEAREVN